MLVARQLNCCQFPVFDGSIAFISPCCSSIFKSYYFFPTWVLKKYCVYLNLFGGFKHFLFSIIYGIILPIDELIFFRGVGQPPTSCFFSISLYHRIWMMGKFTPESPTNFMVKTCKNPWVSGVQIFPTKPIQWFSDISIDIPIFTNIFP